MTGCVVCAACAAILPEDTVNLRCVWPQAQVFGTWLDVISVQVKLEQETKTYEVTTVADSTEALPEKLMLRATPTDLALLDATDADQAHTCWSYRYAACCGSPLVWLSALVLCHDELFAVCCAAVTLSRGVAPSQRSSTSQWYVAAGRSAGSFATL